MPIVRLRTTWPTSYAQSLPSIRLCRSVQHRARRYFTATSHPPNLPGGYRGLLQNQLSMLPPPPLQKQYMSSGTAPKKAPMQPRPSASILLISPSNQILLLHRVRTSSSFPSAHVFPGGNLSPRQDGDIPDATDPQRHIEGPAYRMAAIRECFEESGILLARRNDGSGTFLEVPEEERDKARKDIHSGKLIFPDWVSSQGGVVDTDSLIPFTRWITPTNIPKRFTTQMYIAFLDLPRSNSKDNSENSNIHSRKTSDTLIPVPTSDGGVEHTAALFAPCSEWLRKAQANEIILFPPQFYLMHLLAPFLADDSSSETPGPKELEQQRDAVKAFLQGDGDGRGVPWADKVMSPIGLLFRKSDGRSVLALDKPGPELDGTDRSGDYDRVMLVKFTKEGPRNVDVRWRKDILAEEKTVIDKEAKL